MSFSRSGQDSDWLPIDNWSPIQLGNNIFANTFSSREIWALYYSDFIKVIEWIVNIIFTVEFFLYQADVMLDWNPTRYWGNTLNQMEFVIVVTCWLSYAIDYYANTEFFKEFFNNE